MKLEIEITESEIKSAIKKKIRVAIADETNLWKSDEFIKQQVKKYWASSAEKIVIDCLQDTPAILAKIQFEIEAKLKSQLIALMKEKKDTFK